MISFDLTYELTLGAACAVMSTRRGQQDAFTRGLLVSSLIYIPTCMACFGAWPAWQTMYLVDVSQPMTSLWAAAGTALGLALAYVLGFHGSLGTLHLLGRGSLYAFLGLVWLVVLPLTFGVCWKQAFTVTSYADFHSGRSFSIQWGAPDGLLGGPLSLFLLVSGAINLAALGWLFIRRAPSDH